MESRLIYAAIHSAKSKIQWKVQFESEWLYVGIEDELNKALLLQKIQETFRFEIMLIALSRKDSKQIEYKNFEEEFLPQIGAFDFVLSDLNFTKFMEFNRIGIIRIGEIQKETG